MTVRPPGHHAGYEGHVKSCVSCGFCIFNSVAIAAVHALKSVERVAVLDFDVHHGNGTEEIFRKLNRPSELFFGSAHLYDGTFYPGSGGEDDIRMNIVNAGIPPLWKGKGMGEIGGEDYGRAGWRKEVSRGRPAYRAKRGRSVSEIEGAKNKQDVLSCLDLPFPGLTNAQRAEER